MAEPPATLARSDEDLARRERVSRGRAGVPNGLGRTGVACATSNPTGTAPAICRATARASSSRSASFYKLGRRLGTAHLLGQRACRGGAAGKIEPAVLAIIVEFAAAQRVPE